MRWLVLLVVACAESPDVLVEHYDCTSDVEAIDPPHGFALATVAACDDVACVSRDYATDANGSLIPECRDAEYLRLLWVAVPAESR